MKKILFTVLLVLLLPSSVFAFEKRSGDFVNINSDEIIEGTLFVNASNLDIDGIINGDVFCISPEVKISGTVNGDIICAGENFNMTGTSTGDVRIIFGKAKIEGRIEGNVNAITDTLETQDSSIINGEAFLLANNVVLAGEIKDDLYGEVKNAQISSLVGGDVSLRQGLGHFTENNNSEFKLLSGATIVGDFNFKSNQEPSIEDGVIIKGEENKTISGEEKENASSNIFWTLVLIFSNILIAFVLIALFKNFTLSVSDIIKKQSIKSFWLGILILFLTPISFILLILTMIGIPLAVIVIFVFIGVILISKAIASIVVGEKVLTLIKSKKKYSLNLGAVIGAIILFAIFSIPFIGPAVSSAITILILGATLQYFRNNLNKKPA